MWNKIPNLKRIYYFLSPINLSPECANKLAKKQPSEIRTLRGEYFKRLYLEGDAQCLKLSEGRILLALGEPRVSLTTV